MTRTREILLALGALGMVGLVSSAGGCGGSSSNGLSEDGSGSGDNGGGGGGGGGSGNNPGGGGSSGSSNTFANPMDASTVPCTDGSLNCYVRSDCTTTISGAVYDPAGVNPLYNAVVYIPNDPKGTLSAITQGTKTCNTCDASIGDYVTATISGADGKFQLSGVPATSHVPLVVQIGKWRREVFLPTVTACKDNPVTPQQSRLPANHTR